MLSLPMRVVLRAWLNINVCFFCNPTPRLPDDTILSNVLWSLYILHQTGQTSDNIKADSCLNPNKYHSKRVLVGTYINPTISVRASVRSSACIRDVTL